MSYTSALFTSARYHTSREARDPNYRVLTAASINKSVLEAQYAVRGAIPLRAEELREELEHKGKDAGLPFDEIVSCNIGNPQQLDQKPLTFLRQVSSSSSPSSSWLDSTSPSPLAQRACARLQDDELTLCTLLAPLADLGVDRVPGPHQPPAVQGDLPERRPRARTEPPRGDRQHRRVLALDGRPLYPQARRQVHRRCVPLSQDLRRPPSRADPAAHSFPQTVTATPPTRARST